MASRQWPVALAHRGAKAHELVHGRLSATDPGTGLDLDPSKRLILVTLHRRENFGEPLLRICDALARRNQDCGLVLLKPQEGFFVALQISFMGGFALAFPVIGFQLWRFVAPGLYRSEKNALLPFLIRQF